MEDAKNPTSKQITLASGVTKQTVLDIPKNKIGKLVKLKAHHLTKNAEVSIYDVYGTDTLTQASGVILLDKLTIASGYTPTQVEYRHGIKAIGTIKAQSALVSGVELTLSVDMN